MFSLEIPQNLAEIEKWAFIDCCSLRNAAFPPTAVFGNLVFMSLNTNTDLQQLFGSIVEIVRMLKHRFDGLLIHSIVYYQSYTEGVLQILLATINSRSGQSRTLRSKLNPTGNQQDCLGMTPLHILACSSVHDLEVYCVIVENYPTNLITEDRWGALPLLYAFWGAAPAEIIEFLLVSYQALYPDHVFNWTDMVWTMGRCDTPKERIENLLCVKEMHFSEQPIDWDHLLDEFASPPHVSFYGAPFQERMQFLFMCGLSDRVEALAFKVWRDYIKHLIHTAFEYDEDNSVILREIRDKIAHFEDEFPKLKEATTILELALWKMKMNGQSLKETTKIKSNESSSRQRCRITCGADLVIGHVLPFLITA
jgi:hypothetical protein